MFHEMSTPNWFTKDTVAYSLASSKRRRVKCSVIDLTNHSDLAQTILNRKMDIVILLAGIFGSCSKTFEFIFPVG